jgi:hypothetical protein
MSSYTSLQVVHKEEIEAEQSEIFSLIWLDTNTDVNQNRDAEEKLRPVINHFKRFENVKQCKKYIEQCSKQDQIVLITSGQLGKEIVPGIHHLPQVVSIYIFCYNVEAHKIWAFEHTKVKSLRKTSLYCFFDFHR